MPIGPIRKGAGQFRKVVTLQSGSQVTDPIGGRTIVYSDLFDVRAAIDPAPFIVGGDQGKAEILYQITTRYRDDLEFDPDTGIRRDLRAVAEGRTYAVVKVVDPESRHRDLILHSVEIDV